MTIAQACCEAIVLHHLLLIDCWFSVQGIEASRLLESEGIQTHLTFVYR